MKITKKKILISFGIVVAVVVIAVVVLVANLDRVVNSRKDTLLAQAETRIGRDISVGEVGVAIWPEIGVRVRDVSVSEDPAFGADPFVRVADLRVNVAVMPLLRKRVEIKRFVLNEPVITVVRGGDKRFNFTSLVETASGKAAGAPGAPGGRRATGTAAVPFILAVANIQNGTVHYVDPATSVDRTVRDIDFSAKDVSLDSKISATLAAAVFGEAQDVRVDATIGPIGAFKKKGDLADKPIAATLALGPVKLSALAPPKPGAKPVDPAQDGDVKVDATLSGTFGAAVFDEIAVALTVLGATEPNVEISATAGPFNLLADSTLVFAAARVKGNADAGPFALDAVKTKPAAPGKPAAKLGGSAGGTVAFEGVATALNFTAKMDATQASYEVEKTFTKPAGTPAVIEAKGKFRPQGVENEGIEFSSIDATVHALRARGSGTMVPFKGREAMGFTFDATTSLAPWKDLMPALAPFSPAGDATAKIRISGTPRPGAVPEITGSATFANVSATLPNVPNPLKNGKGTATFTAKSARIADATFTIGKSAFRADADISSFQPMTATYHVVSEEVWRADVQAAAPDAPRLPRPEVFRGVAVAGKAVEIAGAAAPAAGAATPLQNDITITSQSGIASNIDYTTAKATVRATPQKVFIDRFDAKAMGGTLTGSGTFEPAASTFDVASKVEDVNLAEYFRFKSPVLADAVAGRITADFAVSGAGKTWQDIQKTLAGKGGAVVIEGA
ncbi:MAG TPA: AsmA family protein, partial [Candidatus Krumholzibacteria bacterium]|nr:AsmA family protein [Candidatus Krumholzibacteria bacterium]